MGGMVAAAWALLSVYIGEKCAKKFKNGDCGALPDRLLHMQYDKINEMGLSKITARIMASQAEALILDGITSNVDAGAAGRSRSTVLEGCGDKIVFIVSHGGGTGRFVNRCLTVGG